MYLARGPHLGSDRHAASTLSRPSLCMCVFTPQLGDDHLGYLLRWNSLLNDHTRALALSALRPEQNSIPPDQSSGGSGRSVKSRYYRALWRHAAEVVLRVSCRPSAFT